MPGRLPLPLLPAGPSPLLAVAAPAVRRCPGPASLSADTAPRPPPLPLLALCALLPLPLSLNPLPVEPPLPFLVPPLLLAWDADRARSRGGCPGGGSTSGVTISRPCACCRAAVALLVPLVLLRALLRLLL